MPARRTHKRRFGFAIAAWIALQVPSALASSTGIIGYSGKNGGTTCNTQAGCHSGGTAPLVHFEGPTELPLGMMATFKFVVQSQATAQTAAGFDVAVSGGKLGLVTGQDEQLVLNELTHRSPEVNDANGQAMFTFTWTAPATPGTYTLYGAGNSVNNTNPHLPTGDFPAVTTYAIVVTADMPTPTATPSPTDTSAPPSATPTTTPTTTNTPVQCAGDCDHDGVVTVDEIMTGTSIALQLMPHSACPEADVNNDGSVTVDELIAAMNAATGSCRQP